MAGKKYKAAITKIDPEKKYRLSEACALLQECKVAKFDESVDISVRLGIDAKQTDQVVRGAVSLPHGTGKTVRILAFVKGAKEAEAKEAGADFVGGEELVEKIQGGWMDFDKVVATPDMMAIVSKLGKVLGPRGLMPNPKLGTVTFEIGQAVKDVKGGKVEFRNDKAGVVHAAVGKVSFGAEKISDNVSVFISALQKAKPAGSKGHYFKSISLSPTMGPGIHVDTSEFLL
jgi:large subunit ribosomal protein L1